MYLCVMDSVSTRLRCINWYQSPSQVPTTARGSCGGRHAAVDGEYECDEIARNTQLKAYFQQMEEQFEALTKQLAALAVVNQLRNRSPTLRFMEEDEVDYNVEDKMENPFAGHKRRRDKPLVSYNSNK